ncbi:MAG: hypothetical protein GC190_01140 [Alphaproteobacteria bacterium]|nr:hypothetical protein [Alphaproteobacteria bacterium]
MLKYLTGTALGAAMAFAFAAFNVEPPPILKAPARLKANIVATAVEGQLYDLDGDLAARERALEVYLKNRARDAVKLDGEAGHPFLTLLVRARARHEALELLAGWSAYDKVLAQPALRATLEHKYGSEDSDELKRVMLLEALDRKPLLKSWLAKTTVAATAENLRGLLRQAAAPLDEPIVSATNER